MAIFNRFKKALGIEGVRLSIITDSEQSRKAGHIKGQIKLESLSDLIVDTIKITCIERYQRGRNKNKLINEMIIGKFEIDDKISLQKDEVKFVDFDLEFVTPESPMDTLEKQNILYKGFVKLAKLAKSVKSTYRLEAIAEVVGTKLDAIDSMEISFRK